MRARTKLVVPAMVAVLLTALTATGAHAENSGQVVYPKPDEGSSIPHVETSRPDKKPQREVTTPPTAAEAPPKTVEPEVEEGARPGTAVPSRDDEPPAGEGNRERHPPRQSIAENKPVSSLSPSSAGLVANPTGSTDDDGSSPILPILIAIAALAVLSAGVAFYNERFRSRRNRGS